MVTQTLNLPVKCHFSVFFTLLKLPYIPPVVLINPHANAMSLVLEPCTPILLTAKRRNTFATCHVMLIHFSNILPTLVNDFLAYLSNKVCIDTYLF